MGHKSPSVKKRKTLVEPILGLKKIPKKIRSSKSGGRVLDDVFENMTSATTTKTSVCLSTQTKKGSVRPPKRTVCPTTRSDSTIDGPRQWNQETVLRTVLT